GGGKLHLDGLNADIRLVANGNSLFGLSLAGDARNAAHLGYVTAEVAATAVEVLLRALASRGPTARAKDLVRDTAIREMHQLLSGKLVDAPERNVPPEGDDNAHPRQTAGPWPTAHGPRPTANGPRPTAHGPWPTAHGSGPTAHGSGSTADGSGSTADGSGPTPDGPWPTANG